MRYWSASKSATLATLLLFVLLFAVLAIDIMMRVWHTRAAFETPVDVAFILYMEAVRTLVTVAGVGIALVAAARTRSSTPAFGALAFGVAFLTLAYTKLIGFVAFAGALQEQGAIWLRAHGVPQQVLSILFAHPEWACWPALAAFVRFAAHYPRPLTADDVVRSGARDRAGALRSVALAGVDIGRLARAAAVTGLRRGWVRGRIVWSAALVAAVAHTAALRTFRAPLAVHLLAALLAAAPLAAVIALFRAAQDAADARARAPLLWLRRGVYAALVLFATSAVLTPLVPDLLGGVALSLGPAALAACWLVAVLRAPPLPGAARD